MRKIIDDQLAKGEAVTFPCPLMLTGQAEVFVGVTSGGGLFSRYERCEGCSSLEKCEEKRG